MGEVEERQREKVVVEERRGGRGVGLKEEEGRAMMCPWSCLIDDRMHETC